MSAHRTLNDLFRAFDSIGAGRLDDPGDAGTITVAMWGQICSVTTTGGGETRALTQPTKPGILCCVCHDTDGGDFDLTVTGGYNRDNDTGVNFADAKDFVVFYSIKSGTSYYWRVIAQEGTDATVEEGAFDALTATTLTATTANATTLNVTGVTDLRGAAVSAEHGAGMIGTGGVVPVTKRWTENGVIITEILIDLTGLDSSGTGNDVIGLKTGGAAYFGRNVVATNGYIYRVEVQCLELPVAGDVDILFVAGSAADEAFDTTVADTATIADGTGDWTLGQTVLLEVASITANYYYYLTQGAADDATYTAGTFLVRTYGRAAA